MFAFSAAAAPAGTESAQNVMLCGPPCTLLNRIVPPAGTGSEFGSNEALVLPFPVIFTSTTGPAGAAAAPPAAPPEAAGGVAAGGGFLLALFSPPAAAADVAAGGGGGERTAEVLPAT